MPSKTHNDVRHDLTVADCKALASTLRRDLIRPLCIFNFGEDKRIPYIRFDCEESEDLTQTATILGTLIEKVGLRIPTSFVYKKFFFAWFSSSILSTKKRTRLALPLRKNKRMTAAEVSVFPVPVAISKRKR